MSRLNFNENPFGVHKKMICHTEQLNEYLKTGDTFPVVVEINLTDRCNQKCSYCFCDHRGDHTLDAVKVKEFMKDFKEAGGKAITFSGGGEPTLHPDFDDIVWYARCSLKLELGLITNGLFKSTSLSTIGMCFKWVRVSLDTVDRGLYKTIRGVDKLDDVMDNIKALCSYGHKLGINCNVTGDMTVADVSNLIIKFPFVDYIQFRPVLPRFVHEEKVGMNEMVWDFLKSCKISNVVLSYDKFIDLVDGKVTFPFKSCEGHFFSPILDSNGDLKVCMYHPGDDDFTFGNIYEKNFFDIWKSEKRKKVVDFLQNFDYINKCQVCCKLFEINKFIDFIKNPDDDLDINFL